MCMFKPHYHRGTNPKNPTRETAEGVATNSKLVQGMLLGSIERPSPTVLCTKEYVEVGG